MEMIKVDVWLIYIEIIILAVMLWAEKQENIKNWLIKRKALSTMIMFGMAFGVYFISLLARGSLANGSGDAISIWGTITSWYSGDVQSSYVLYKGMFAVYPYVWLYRLACIFGTNEFFFVMLYNALLFAYVVAVGMPAIFERIFDRESTLWRKWLFIIFVFNLQASNYAYYEISIDIPSLFWFVLMIDMSVRIWKGKKEKYLFEIFAIGVAAGATLCFSGQFLLAGVLGIVLGIIVVARKKSIKQTIMCIAIISVCVIGIKLTNNLFMSQVVEPMRASGEWLPTGNDWIISNLTNKEPFLGTAYRSEGDLHDTQGTYINSVEQPQYTWDMSFGEVLIEYFKTVLKHPVDFLIGCGNKLFLAFCMDWGSEYRFLSLGLGFTLFFIGMYEVVRRYFGTIQLDIIEYLIGVAFFFTILVPCAIHMELRYAMAIQDFVYGFGIFGANIAGVIEHDEDGTSRYKALFRKQYIGKFLGGALFVMFCIMHYMALLD